MSERASGFDLFACLEEPVTVPAGKFCLVSAGFSMEIPHHYEAQIRPRSGLAAKHGITLLNTPGTIDSDYRGEVKVILINLGSEDVKIENGDRIAQMVIAKIPIVDILEVDELSQTERGSGGFGSTGY